MVAYPFRPHFIEPIEAGRKGGTIRGLWRSPHARRGELMQLYAHWRTPKAKLLGVYPCIAISPIVIDPRGRVVSLELDIVRAADLDCFAVYEGYRDWPGLLTEHETAAPGRNLYHLRWTALPAKLAR